MITPTRQKLSIHGRTQDGKPGIGKYNPNPQPNREPTTKRGKRRLANKGKGK